MKQHVVGKGCVVEEGVVGKGGECGVVEQHVVGSGCVVEQGVVGKGCVVETG